MLSHSIIVENAFRIINFGIVFGLVGYSFYSYMLPIIKKQIKEKLDYFFQLRSEIKNTSFKSEEVDESIKYQEQYAQALLDKIKKWNLAWGNAQKSKVVEQENAIVRVQNKQEIQTENLTKYRIKNEVIPEVINNSTKDLVKEFESEERANIYLEELVSFLNKNK